MKKYYPVRGGLLNRERGQIKAVDGVSFEIQEGKTLGIAGESGSGKSTLCMCIARLLKPTSGTLIFDGEEYTRARREKLRKIRSKLQIVFQNPLSSLDPYMIVRNTILEPLTSQGLLDGVDRDSLVHDLLEMVGLAPYIAKHYPHELSGGQSQRVAIARALSVKPKLLVLDEPTSALDASIQAQLLNLFNSLQKELGITYLIVSHDLSVIGHMSDQVAVMYAGKVVETGTFDEIFYNTAHPYTAALLASAHLLRREELEGRFVLRGDPPSPRKPPAGCTLHPRCPFASEVCTKEFPPLLDDGIGHEVACYHEDEVRHELNR